jgi:transposase InsO family protein
MEKVEDKVIGIANAVFLLSQSSQDNCSFITNNNYLLYKSTLLDSGTTIDIFNDLSRFLNFKKAPQTHVVRCGNHLTRILGYGTVDVDVRQGNKQGILRIRDAAYCPDFITSLVSFVNLKKRNIFWDTEENQLYRTRASDRSVICTLQEIGGQQVINYRPIERHREAFAVNRVPRRRITSRDPRPPRKGDGMLWHRRMGHPSPMAVHKLGQNSLGTKLRGPSIVQCPHCSLAKIRRQVSRRPPMRDRSIPGSEIHIDWTDLEESFEGFVRIMFFTDAASGMVTPYFMSTYGTERENLAALKDHIEYLENRHSLKVKVVHSDNELFTKRTCRWLNKKGIDCEPSAPRTPSQNGFAERSGGVIMAKSRAMRIGANFPHDLWKETVNSGAYLHNRTPKESLGWKTPYEVFYAYTAKLAGLDENKKPQLAHLRAYGCRAYAMTEDAQLKKRRLWKLDPRAHIGYLVGYDSTNIFRIWIPHQGKVISTRDVLFDEETFFDGKRAHLSNELIAHKDDLVERISLDRNLAKNEGLLEEDEEIFSSEQAEESDGSNDDDVQLFNEKEDYELSRAVEEGLITPPWSEVGDFDKNSAFGPYVPFPVGDRAGPSNHKNDDLQAEFSKLQDDQNVSQSDPFEYFQRVRIGSAFHGTFEGHRMQRKIHKKNLPPPPRTAKDLRDHPFRKEFEAAQREHLQSHEKMGSFVETDKSQVKGQQVLGCMWVFIYKTDKHGFLQKYKARLVVWGHQQAQNGLPTRATTLASTTFRTLMAITAKFDLETQQMDAVNAFVNCDLDETVFMKFPPGFEKPNKVLRLRKALYGLRRSPLLWQKELTKTFKELGFREVPEEPCVMLKGGVIVFFYVDDIVFCYRKKDQGIVEATRKGLEAKYQLSFLGELKWFLGIHILRDRQSRKLWLSQRAYIDKLTSRFEIDTSGRLPDTPMSDVELMPSNDTATKSNVEQFQRKTGSILFAATTTRPDIAFACSRLARFNTNPNKSHHEAADRVLKYLYHTRGYALQYGHQKGAVSLICASDASFADNTIDRKSSQGFIMKLFGGPIAWRANKQDTVTTSSTEAELLALSQTAKESIFFSRLLKALMLRLDDPLIIQCDNRQTLRLLNEESAKLTTKLRHVDIHRHWLRQEVREKRVTLNWVPTKQMLADGLTKSLGRQKHERFCNLIGLTDETNRLDRELRLEELRDTIQSSKKQDNTEEELVLTSGKANLRIFQRPN